MQRCLWASTSTKNPDYRDVLYVEELIGPQTVDTMPLETIEAFVDHGRLETEAGPGRGEAHATCCAVEPLGIRMETVTDELIVEGVAAFTQVVRGADRGDRQPAQALAPA